VQRNKTTLQKIFEGQGRKWQIRKCKLDSLIFKGRKWQIRKCKLDSLIFHEEKSYHMVLGGINPTNWDVHRSKLKLASYFMGLPCMLLHHISQNYILTPSSCKKQDALFRHESQQLETVLSKKLKLL
jgi:hypothetical protein